MNYKRFYIIEVLIVMAILAMMVSILYPKFGIT